MVLILPGWVLLTSVPGNPQVMILHHLYIVYRLKFLPNSKYPRWNDVVFQLLQTNSIRKTVKNFELSYSSYLHPSKGSRAPAEKES